MASKSSGVSTAEREALAPSAPAAPDPDPPPAVDEPPAIDEPPAAPPASAPALPPEADTCPPLPAIGSSSSDDSALPHAHPSKAAEIHRPRPRSPVIGP